MKTKIQLSAAVLCLLVLLFGCADERIYAQSRATEFPDGIYTITAGGRYVFSGEHRGQILIAEDVEEAVELVFDGFSLYNPDGPAIRAQHSQSLKIILPDGTVNAIGNSGSNDAIFSDADLVISGGGALNVNANRRHGIRTQGFLTINGGIINVTAANNALRSREGVTIEGGVITLNADGDAIISSRNRDPERGFVVINDGTLDITSARNDGIQAASAAIIRGGRLRIAAAKGDGISSGNSIIVTGGDIDIAAQEGIEGKNATITGGRINIVAGNDGINVRNAGSNEDVFLRVTGGYVNINSLKDSIESDGNIYIEGGTIRAGGAQGRLPCGNIIITGGEFISTGNRINVSGASAQATFVATFSGRQAAGALIEVKDTAGCVLLSYTAPQNFAMAIFSSPRFTVGATYSLYVNGARVAATVLDRGVTNFSV